MFSQEQIWDLILKYGTKLVTGIVVLLIGIWIVKALMKVIKKSLKERLDPSLYSFALSISKLVLYVLLFISVAATMGVEMTAFIAALGSIGIALGLALQGSLSNVAGGVLILFYKPFKVGDYIEGNGVSGTVQEIQMIYTIVTTVDNKKITVPNGDLANNNMTNYSAEDTRRVDLTFGVSYEDDLDHVREVISKVLKEEERIFQEPEPVIKVTELADSSVNFIVKAWSKRSDYLNTKYDLQENMKKAFDKENISMPFPQMDVHIIHENS